MADAIVIRLMDEPAIDWAGACKLEKMKDALRAADKHDLTTLFEFVGT
jgi:hypothetical protein